jgi:hypothetical protein
MLGFVFFLFEAPDSIPRERRNGPPRGLDDDRGRLAPAGPWPGRRARLAEPLLDQAPDELAQRGAAQRGAGLERPVQLVWKVNGRSHKHILMRTHLAVKARAG